MSVLKSVCHVVYLFLYGSFEFFKMIFSSFIDAFKKLWKELPWFLLYPLFLILFIAIFYGIIYNSFLGEVCNSIWDNLRSLPSLIAGGFVALVQVFTGLIIFLISNALIQLLFCFMKRNEVFCKMCFAQERICTFIISLVSIAALWAASQTDTESVLIAGLNYILFAFAGIYLIIQLSFKFYQSLFLAYNRIENLYDRIWEKADQLKQK